MNAAYKQEKKKNSKRKTHITPLSFKITDPLFYAEDSPCPKKLKDNLFLSFPDESVLNTAQSDASEIKTELSYRLDKPDVHWAAQPSVMELTTGTNTVRCYKSPVASPSKYCWRWPESWHPTAVGAVSLECIIKRTNLFSCKLSWIYKMHCGNYADCNWHTQETQKWKIKWRNEVYWSDWD